jgi:uncharacterized protein YecE (DUF72 family)
MRVIGIRKGLTIGTSGWSYADDDGWKGIFYRSSTSMLKQYLSYFDTAEINSTFYALPQPKFIRYLVESVPDGKFFTAKLPRKVTHDTRLRLAGEGGDTLTRFHELMRPAKDKILVLLIQLPPWKMSSMGSLEQFFTALDTDFRYAIEFRDKTWLKESTWNLLEDYGVAHVVVDEPKLPVDLRVTTDFSYIRWHGHGEKPWYRYLYDVDELEEWVPRVRALENQTESVLGYFNNHFHGNAPLNALQMLSLVGQTSPRQEMKLESMLAKKRVKQTSLDDFSS